MAATLIWTREAETSLQDVYHHIARDRPETAQRTLGSLLNRVDSLRHHPTLGSPFLRPDGRQIRRLTYGQFQIAYLLENGSEVVVLGIFHGLIFLPLK